MTLNRIFRESEFTVTRLQNGFGLVDEKVRREKALDFSG
jgi:hypothetical protein